MRGVKLLLVAALGALLVLTACNLQTLVGPDDKAIVAEIQSKLFQDPVLKTRSITVNSQKGVVVLNGAVGSDAEKASAEDIANKASGVKQVIDQLTVTTASPQAAPPTQTASAAPAEPPVLAPEAQAPTRTRRSRHEGSAAKSKASRSGESEGTGASPPSPATTPTTTAEATPTPTTPPPPPKPEPVTIPAGAVVTVQMIDPIDSSKNKPGEEFSATLFSAIVVDDKVVAPRGANARVRLVQSASAGHMEGQSELDIQLISVDINGQSYAVDSNTYKKAGASRGKRTAETVGGGAVVGALIGGLIGHGKGAAIGAGVGAGSGVAVQEGTKGQQVQIPSESKIDFTLKSPITVNY